MHHKKHKNFPSNVIINRHFESDTDLQCLQMLSYLCVNEPMCPRPYPVYTKMRAEANKRNKTTVSWCVCVCVRCTQFLFVLKKQSSNLWVFYCFSVTKNEKNTGQ